LDIACPAIQDPIGIRRAGRELLSLALIDARNRTLSRLAGLTRHDLSAAHGEFEPPAWLAGHCGWFQESWTARHPQRGRGGEAGEISPNRLVGGIEPEADAWYDKTRSTRAMRWQPGFLGDHADPAMLLAYLVATHDITQDLLAAADEDDDGLYGYRLALLHEDRIGETLAEIAQVCGLADAPAGPGAEARSPSVAGIGAALSPTPVARATRPPLAFAAQRWLLGSPPGGLVPDNEKWAHGIEVPAFEIDAQVVNWAQYAEFVVDGGYDEPRWWSAAGWTWVQATGRRSPRHVEQLGASVLLRRGGRLQRVPAAQAAVHVTAHEAAAWCAWAGRRLPTEPEWDLAVAQGGGRGLAWGDVFEWTASAARPWPGHVSGPARMDDVTSRDPRQVLRGASLFTAPRWKHPKARRFADPASDALFCGFRSCSP
jgi:ergothioneine biosynthesis protein EgtB